MNSKGEVAATKCIHKKRPSIVCREGRGAEISFSILGYHLSTLLQYTPHHLLVLMFISKTNESTYPLSCAAGTTFFCYWGYWWASSFSCLQLHCYGLALKRFTVMKLKQSLLITLLYQYSKLGYSSITTSKVMEKGTLIIGQTSQLIVNYYSREVVCVTTHCRLDFYLTQVSSGYGEFDT